MLQPGAWQTASCSEQGGAMTGFYQVVHSRVNGGAAAAMLALRRRFVAAVRRAVPEPVDRGR
jgi:hypothetical protein